MSVSVFGFVHVSVLHGGAKREYQIPWRGATGGLSCSMYVLEIGFGSSEGQCMLITAETSLWLCEGALFCGL